ncbi:hypothetical protein GOP47_0008557 [Adiantum capillus-veneris]|uniref:Non-specific lipid-transfer protein n=1 Tax=Adiantum capillus-veneris TaxID=13818 RepID=A0A9D4ZJU5_ADICA|nr:hypothetical protein GOP47_0008557 [Adiantum capillus-veneris]
MRAGEAWKMGLGKRLEGRSAKKSAAELSEILTNVGTRKCTSKGAEALTCSQVQGYFVKCVPYLFTLSPKPTPACCASLANLNKQAVGPARKSVCECIKQNAAKLGKNLNQGRAKSLSKACNIPLKTSVSLNTDCSKA